MSNRGGRREGAGRKTKNDEQAMIERLSPMDDLALKALKAGLTAHEFPFVKLFFEYRYGKPLDKMEVTGKDGGPLSPMTDTQVDRIIQTLRGETT